MPQKAYIYGLRERNSQQYFYVGSTKVSVARRLHCHLTTPANLHLERRIKKATDEVIAEDLEVVSVTERFQREFAWIQKLIGEGHPLCNVLLVEPDYTPPPLYSDKEILRKLGMTLTAGITCRCSPPTERYADLFWECERVAVVCARAMMLNFPEQILAMCKPK